MKKRWLTDSQYEVCMKALGYTYDKELNKFFKNDICFLGNVGDDVVEVGDLITTWEDGQLTCNAKAIATLINWGAELFIGEGAIDGYGVKSKKGLYCTNYRELFSDKKKIRSKKVED